MSYTASEYNNEDRRPKPTESKMDWSEQVSLGFMKVSKKTIAMTVAGVIAVSALMAGNPIHKIPEGTAGLQTSVITGAYQTKLLDQGLHLTIDNVKLIDTTQNATTLQDVNPKDKDGLMFQDLDVTFFYNINTENAEGITNFLKTVGDLPALGNGQYSLGANMVLKEARSAILSVTSKMTSKEVMTERAKYESEIVKDFQAKLDEKYPGIFKVSDVNIASLKFPAQVENQIQSIAAKDSESRKIEIESAQLAAQTALQKAKLNGNTANFIGQYKLYKETADAIGVPVSVIIAQQNKITELQTLQAAAEKGNLTIVMGNGVNTMLPAGSSAPASK